MLFRSQVAVCDLEWHGNGADPAAVGRVPRRAGGVDQCLADGSFMKMALPQAQGAGLAIGASDSMTLSHRAHCRRRLRTPAEAGAPGRRDFQPRPASCLQCASALTDFTSRPLSRWSKPLFARSRRAELQRANSVAPKLHRVNTGKLHLLGGKGVL